MQLKRILFSFLCIVIAGAVFLVLQGNIASKLSRIKATYRFYTQSLQQVGVSKIVVEPSLRGMREGGLIAQDLENDGVFEILLTHPSGIWVYSVDGVKRWNHQEKKPLLSGTAEKEGLPGLHAPGIQVADVNQDGTKDILFISTSHEIIALNGANGTILWQAFLTAPSFCDGWEHLVVANLSGQGDRELILQATNQGEYRLGRFLAAYRIADLAAGNYEPLWKKEDFIPCAHNGLRVADINLDGRDEILGASLIDSNGQTRFELPLRRFGDQAPKTNSHADAVYAADIVPDSEGLEVVILQEKKENTIFTYNYDRILWKNNYMEQEPQNAAIGDFDLHSPGLEIWCRSRYQTYQKPFVFNSSGKMIATYDLMSHLPLYWTKEGIEVINSIHWTGKETQLITAKERHKSGNVVILDPIRGEFFLILPEEADRLYVADVSGDWREEVIVWNDTEIHIYENKSENPRPNQKRLWELPHYQRQKMTWNYYSP